MCVSITEKFHLSKEIPAYKSSLCGRLSVFLEYIYRNHPVVPSLDQLAGLFPILSYYIYLVFTPGHDCFECFNRLPNTRYSIFQLSRYEANRRREEVDGEGAVRNYKQLIAQAEKEAMMESGKGLGVAASQKEKEIAYLVKISENA